MSEQTIEVGDVFTFHNEELVAVSCDNDWIYSANRGFYRPDCRLIRKAVPLQPGCKWVKAREALQPTDFRIMQPSGKVTAEQQGRSWSIALADHTWQRPQLLDTDLPYLMKCIKDAAKSLPEYDRQRFIWEMLQIQSQAGAALSKLRERAEGMAKALNEAGPARELLETMAEIEDSSRSISIGGLASDVGMLTTEGDQP